MSNERFRGRDKSSARLAARGATIWALGLLCAVSAQAEVGLRIDSQPASEPIEAYVLVTVGGAPISGLTADDFAVTLDGAAFTDFEWTPPPSQDPAQKVSILITMSVFDPMADRLVDLIESLDTGDFVAIARSVPCLEMPRTSTVVTQPFTEVDHGAGSASLIEFIETRMSGGSSQCLTPESKNSPFLVGLDLFAGAALPVGPKAMLGFGGVGSRDLSDLVDISNASRVSVFTLLLDELAVDPAAAAARTAFAHNTGGVSLEATGTTGDAVDALLAWLKHGYRLTIPRTAVDDCNEHMLEVTVGGFSTSAAFERCDATPEMIQFDYRYPVDPGSIVVSEPRAITSIESPVAVTVFGGEYSIGCGSTFTSEAGTILPEEAICLRHTAAATNDTTTLTLLITGGVSSYLSSLTPPAAVSPPPPPHGDPPSITGGGGSSGAVEALLLLALLFARSSAAARIRPELQHSAQVGHHDPGINAQAAERAFIWHPQN